MVTPHYTDFVGESEIGIQLAEAMDDLYLGLVELVHNSPLPEHSQSVNQIAIGQIRRKLDAMHTNEIPEELKQFHAVYELLLHEISLAEEVYKDAILEISEQITEIVANQDLSDTKTYKRLSKCIETMHKYIDSIPNVRLEEIKERRYRR